MSPSPLHVIASLAANQSASATVLVHLRPASPEASPPDVANFSSAREWRQAMIDHRQGQVLSGQSEICQDAASLGLSIKPLQVLHALILHGPPGKLAELLRQHQEHLASVSLDTEITLP